jgi:hypothetical protein
MAHDVNPHQEPQGMDAHNATYDGFLKGSVGLSIVCGFVLVALVSFRFIDNWNVLIGFGGLLLGILATLIDARATGKWYLSGGLLVLYGLFVAASL